ncbi:MAG TPA: alpha/beta fold hydrolase, partial [Polyangiaceae bacterium]
MLKCDVRGEGELVVLLHSGGMSSRQWRRLAERLAGNHRVVSPDFLGSGDNPPWPPEAPFDFHADVAEIRTILDAFGPAAHLVGHSYGGLVAATVARQRHADVRSLCLYDPVAFGTLHDPADPAGLADLDRVVKNPVFLDDARGGTDAWFSVFLEYWNGPGSWAALPAPAREAFLRVGRKVYFEVRSLMADQTPASAYAVVRAPTLLLTGERTP